MGHSEHGDEGQTNSRMRARDIADDTNKQCGWRLPSTTASAQALRLTPSLSMPTSDSSD